MNFRLVVALTACLLAGLEASNAQDNPAGLCSPEAAASLIGKARITDDQAKQLTGATIVRQIKPGDAVTMDYRRERITIETDPKTGIIVRAGCG